MSPVPTAPLAVIAYGDPATVAVAAAPVLVNVTLVTASLLTNWPELVMNSVPPNVALSPYVFNRLFAVTSSCLRFTFRVPLCGVTS